MHPYAAKTESRSPASKTAVGSVSKISTAAAESEVRESDSLLRHPAAMDMTCITPALTTDTENPVRAMYKSMAVAVILLRVRCFSRVLSKALPKADTSTERCSPLRANR